MKAIVYEKYGSPEVLKLQEIEKPIPKDNEVLVKVLASSVNNWDWDRLTGKPYLYQLISGIGKPKLKILGADIAGIVESVGSKVDKWKPGDEVYGDLSEGKWGGFAEFVCANENALAEKPASMSFEQAAAIPQAGVMALQAIRDQKPIGPDNRILINGAGGGIGSFAIQLAKNFKAHITAVDSAEKFDFMLGLGADEVIDYKKEDFTKNGKQYDLIIDVISNRKASDYKHSLSQDGVLSVVGGLIPSIINVAIASLKYKGNGGRKMGILMHKPNMDLGYINELFENGKLKPIIDKVYPLDKTSEAVQYIGDGKVMGKVIIKTTH